MDLKKIMAWLSVLFLITYIPYSQLKFPYKRWRIDQNLKFDTAYAQGVLVSHNWYDAHMAISIVEFKVDSIKFFAKLDRLKAPIGIPLTVKYKISDPHWCRVLVPDTLKAFQSSWANIAEENFYTWPPTINKRMIYNKNSKEGPY